ncbi:hypothetical protein Tsubulata_020949 [Turnera subulata]|uniref:Succinate dehydrogenase assembly factor 4, mitochondrial n=1 Tax=Turnera subulata TaxID=218843 RepID=A0A9Q0F068_9ROSI|nr:hypothetical protein Tsubulata_020949 [Turnera subulata]
MARTNLRRLFSDLSSAPKLAAAVETRSESVVVRSFGSSWMTRFISSSSSSSSQQQQEEDGESVKKQQLVEEEEEEAIKQESQNKSSSEDDEDDDDDDVNEETGEVGGPRGPEPTRYGDWERNGRCYDF